MATKQAQDKTTETPTELNKVGNDGGRVIAISFLGGDRKAVLTQSARGFGVKVIQAGKQLAATFYSTGAFKLGEDDSEIVEEAKHHARVAATFHFREISQPGGDGF
jgi:predicted Zn-dependent protease